MYAILIFLHVGVSVGLILVVLLQSSKGGGLAGTLGGASMGVVFGGRGAAGFLTKLTTGLAIAFVASCLLHSAISPKTSPEVRSALQKELKQKSQESAPAAALPGGPAPAIEEEAAPSSESGPE